LLEEVALKEKLRELFIEKSWSPEQISKRLEFEKSKFEIIEKNNHRPRKSLQLENCS